MDRERTAAIARVLLFILIGIPLLIGSSGSLGMFIATSIMLIAVGIIMYR